MQACADFILTDVYIWYRLVYMMYHIEVVLPGEVLELAVRVDSIEDAKTWAVEAMRELDITVSTDDVVIAATSK